MCLSCLLSLGGHYTYTSLFTSEDNINNLTKRNYDIDDGRWQTNRQTMLLMHPWTDVFVLARTRPFKLYKTRSFTSTRANFFSERIINVCNALLTDVVD